MKGKFCDPITPVKTLGRETVPFGTLPIAHRTRTRNKRWRRSARKRAIEELFEFRDHGLLITDSALTSGRITPMNNDPVLTLIFYFLLPLWMAAGFADWWCHLKARIEHNAGVQESLIHLLMFAQMGAGLLACLFLELNALVFAILIGLFATHEATALWDISFASARRRISPIEQQVHSFLELLPLLGIALLAGKYWPALQTISDQDANWVLRLKSDPVPLRHVIAVLGAATVFAVMPFAEEVYRTWRARSRAA